MNLGTKSNESSSQTDRSRIVSKNENSGELLLFVDELSVRYLGEANWSNEDDKLNERLPR